MGKMHRAWAEVNLDAIAHNIGEIKKITGESKIMAVVKADAYGHGYLEVTKTLLDSGVDVLGVAILDEALKLRERGIKTPILVFGASDDCSAAEFVRHDIMPTVFTYEFALALSLEAQKQNKKALIHIKVDTGMNRLGLLSESSGTVSEIEKIANLPEIIIDGIFTHFACADEIDKSYTKMQFERFCNLCSMLSRQGIEIPNKHACNSAGIIMYPEMHLDMVRAGIALYGLYPSREVDQNKLNLIPAMTLKAAISHIKNIGANERISYGGNYETKGDSVIATVPIGYADGYSRLLSNRAFVLAGDIRTPIVGNICMDQCMIDITKAHNINIGDEVVLFGHKNELFIPVEELTDIMGTINYELPCIIGKRIPRVYIQGGKIVEVIDYLA